VERLGDIQAAEADYLKALPHATLVPLPNVGHLPFEESPEASLVPLRRFLSAR
jgi:pimeloyl-ACP methyl ester carboxylesterase